MVKTLIFDFDGVLADTYRMAFELEKKYRPTLTEEEFKKMFCGNYWQSLNKEEQNSRDWDEFNAEYLKYIRNTRIDQDLKAILETMKFKYRYKMHINSSGSEQNIKAYLKYNDLDIFDSIMGFETDKSKIRKFEKILDYNNSATSHYVFITDTEGDIKEAHELGIPTIGVTWGYHNPHILQKAQPHSIAYTYNELINIINWMDGSA